MLDLRGDMPGTCGVDVRRRIDAWIEPLFSSRDGSTKVSRMEVLFRRFSARWGAEFGRLFADDAARDAWQREWADAFAAERLTDRAVKMGLDRSRRRMSPPTLAEFLELACPVPSIEGAFAEAQTMLWRRASHGDDVWSHPAIYWAAVDFGTVELRTASWSTSQGRWTRYLTDRLRQSWCPPVPGVRSAPVVDRDRSRFVARSAIDGARMLLDGKRSPVVL